MSQKKTMQAAKSAVKSVAKPAVSPKGKPAAQPSRPKAGTAKAAVSAPAGKIKPVAERSRKTVQKSKPAKMPAATPTSVGKSGIRPTVAKGATSQASSAPKASRKPPAITRQPSRKMLEPAGLAALSAAAAKSAVRFSNTDLDDFRKLLRKLRDDLAGKVAYLRDSSLRRDDEVNQAEDGSDAFDRLFSLERAGGVQERIYAIDEALHQIDEGSYGICQNCASLIRKQRLLALPFAQTCIDCQAQAERQRNGQNAAASPRRFVP